MIRFFSQPSSLALLFALSLPALPAAAQNLDNGREIHLTCAGCHGKYAQGGKDGEYPRLAGQRAGYIEDQLRAFRARKRINFPMLTYTEPRVLPDRDIVDIAAYLSEIRLHPRPPGFSSATDARRRREELDKVLRIEPVEGDITQGKGIYQAECAGCHGRNGRGRSDFPMLVGQYTRYLKKQIDAFRRGDRPHDEQEASKGTLIPLTEADVRNVLAYLTAIQDEVD
jgi:cytochrome c553